MSKRRGGLVPDSRNSIKARKVKSRLGNPNNFIDESGQRFGRLLVLRANGRYNNEVVWLCQCDCGVQKTIRGITLRRGEAKSCGCLQKELLVSRSKASVNPRKEELRSIVLQKQKEGLSLSAIARYFTENNIESLGGGKWYSSTISHILNT